MAKACPCFNNKWTEGWFLRLGLVIHQLAIESALDWRLNLRLETFRVQSLN